MVNHGQPWFDHGPKISEHVQHMVKHGLKSVESGRTWSTMVHNLLNMVKHGQTWSTMV